jgi:DNA helicase-2/ATP-dependent DNA helicase PcrA
VTERIIALRRNLQAAESYGIDYANLLNPAQLAAATHRDGPLLVIAGAGSGKTRTLIYRVARLIESGIAPGAILLLTFTRRAAQEMLRRVEGLLGDRARGVAGGTFHSFAHQVLRRHGAVIGLKPNFTILDRSDMEDVINLVRAASGLVPRDRRFPKKSALAEVISIARNKRRALADEIEFDFPHLAPFQAEIIRLADDYARYKQERSLLDYDDLLERLIELLEQHEQIRHRLAATYRYLMVDEYQDTNIAQAEIVRLLGQHGNVVAVGDDAQSIYSFRGANFRNILEFPTLFPGARIIKLEQNYRSLQGILDVANQVIAGAPEQYTKTLFTRREGATRPLLVRAVDEHMQSRFVAQRILELREEGVGLGEIAVLFRSSFHSFDLELELQRCDIPFIKRGGFKFIETAHIKDVLAHLRVIANPSDAVSWLRVLMLMPGVGQRTASRALNSLSEGVDPVKVLAGLLPAAPDDRRTAALHRLLNLLGELRTANPIPARQIASVLEYYAPILRENYPDDFPRRERDLEHFQTITERYRSLEAMLADMALEPPSDSLGGVLATDVEDEFVTLSTVHSAKGLEWRAVFIIWAADGRFPAPQGVAPDELEEERRLMYVAITRARDELYLVYPMYMFDRAIGYTMGQPSRFLDYIDPKLLPAAILQESDDAGSDS